MARPGSAYCESTSTPTDGWRARIGLGRAQPLVGLGGWHPNVDDGHVGRVARDLAQQLVGRRAAGDDLEAAARQQPGEPLAEQHAVPRPALPARDLRAHARAVTGRARHVEVPAERLDPVAQPA